MFTTARTAALAFALSAAAATTAYAQVGPGACDCGVAPAPAPVAAEPARLPKWGIGLRAGGMTLAPEQNKDAKTEYSVGGVQLRYRIAPRWQIELSAEHAVQKLEDGTEGEAMLDSGTIAALYHFRPYARWDWYVLAGFGATVDGREEITDEQREASKMGHVHLGAGVERRWNHFALAAEMRAVGMAPPEEEDKGDAITPAGMSTEPVPPAETDRDRRGISGGQLTINATYYF